MEQDSIIFEMQAQLCQVLGHSIRLRIVNALKASPMCVNELVAALKTIPQPTVSRHLAVLRSAGILLTHRRGMEVIYEIANPKIINVCEMMRTVLAERELRQIEIFSHIQA
jgi:ArsR family transcriptional regulator, virulence genes transcriptional regulator